MPELPEVEVTRRNLLAWTAGRRLVGVDAPDPAVVRAKLSTLPSDALAGGTERVRTLVGARTETIRRHGKRLGWTFAGRDLALLVHLGMTGQWFRRGAEDVTPRVRLVLAWSGDVRLWLDDSRRFGCVVPIAVDQVDDALRAGHGPDALDEAVDAAGLRGRLTGGRPVKTALMDQAVVAGIGNIEAAESLWRARVHPDTPCRALDAAAIARLAAAIPETLRIGIASMEGEERVYVTQGGENPFSIYGREGERCPRCGGIIAKTRHAGRATFYCPTCQPEDTPL